MLLGDSSPVRHTPPPHGGSDSVTSPVCFRKRSHSEGTHDPKRTHSGEMESDFQQMLRGERSLRQMELARIAQRISSGTSEIFQRLRDRTPVYAVTSFRHESYGMDRPARDDRRDRHLTVDRRMLDALCGSLVEIHALLGSIPASTHNAAREAVHLAGDLRPVPPRPPAPSLPQVFVTALAISNPRKRIRE